jgi:hypothetical protein
MIKETAHLPRRRLENASVVEDFGCIDLICKKFGIENPAQIHALTHYYGIAGSESAKRDKFFIAALPDNKILLIEFATYRFREDLGAEDRDIYIANLIDDTRVIRTLRVIDDLEEEKIVSRSLSIPAEFDPEASRPKPWVEVSSNPKTKLPEDQQIPDFHTKNVQGMFDRIYLAVISAAKQHLNDLPSWVTDRTGDFLQPTGKQPEGRF